MRSTLRKLAGSALAAASLTTTLPAAAVAKENVTYLLPAPPTLPAFAPWIVAKQNGYYDAAGLNVTFVAARGGVDVAKQIGSGNAIVGGAIGDTPIIVRANGVPVRAVAVLGGGSLTMIAATKASGVNNVKDLAGKTMTVMSYADTTYYALLGSLKLAGLDKQKVAVQASGPAGVWQMLAGGQVAAMAGVPDWVVSAQEAGGDIHLLPAEQQFKSMGQAILASDEAIRKQPELLRKLVQATLHGMKDIMDDPAAAAKSFAAAVPAYQGKEATLVAVFRLYGKHVYPGQETLGLIDAKRLKEVQDFYLAEGIVQRATPVEDLYTNQFVKTGQ
ncbi:MAG TPA: ABC transporter substrate-binding protein [Aromatoleum sp.]|uniref:ABC transporter substrate-binding protein n=1 Tax=Aromatoleum sp. TaxID=2307007 RepID=UPI002B48EB0D|nr:ABC transporter substrate-binding protein [Aromatoleum sp.]HJV27737.1 ABC transporter substrate-binding protein [Aromatoleum sp.]